MSGLFKPKQPTVEAPVPMADEAEATKARRRRVAKEVKGTGVQSTILSAGGRETLGG